MKLLEPSVEILYQGHTIIDMYRHITKCAYTCYKTDKEITDDSAEKFVNKLIESGHTAMLEHGTVPLAIPFKESMDNDKVGDIMKQLMLNPYTEWTIIFKDNKHYYLITTNYRVIIENNLKDFMEKYWLEDYNRNDRITVKIITDRGVTHELVRHKLYCAA